MKVECPRCHTHVEKPLHGDPACPTCGFGAPEGSKTTGAEALSPPTSAAAPGPGFAGASTGISPAGWEQTGGTTAPKQGLAITALVLGILGCCTFFPLFGIGGIVFGAIALKKIKDEPQTFGGHGMALAGLILGIIGTVVSIIAIIFYGVLLAAVFDCEENPDSEFCRSLEESRSEPARATLVPMAAPGLLGLGVMPRAWHAG